MANFRTRARAVDMLGRQQIAGIPTAISELFKNAHDAYADRVEVDFYRNDRLFVLRDDGIGMTREEFEARWLTLGTESKVGHDINALPYTPPDKTTRILLGEKGIGRLAIAAIGNQVLILTRAKRHGRNYPVVVAFIHWGIFECPGLNLDEIEIPVIEFSSGVLPDTIEIRGLVEIFRGNIIRNLQKFPPELAERINEDLDVFIVDPREIDGYLKSPDLSLVRGQECGTHFIIFPASELLALDIDFTDKASEIAPPLVKVLLGFTNTMSPDRDIPVIVPAFRDWKSDVRDENLIEEKEFFTPDDYLAADHRIKGEFDEFGQFVGSVFVYGKEFTRHIIPWSEGRGAKVKCGAFSITLAVVQGDFKQSNIIQEQYYKLKEKLNKIGGLYIYRNGIRVLPYGGPDFDWLDFELKRTKSASYYYFSYRRLFGIVNIDNKNNIELKEKAGREGFSENKAYRELKSILKNFFLQLTADFFREDARQSNHFITIRTEIERLAAVRKKREEQVSVKRQKFEKELDIFFADYDSGNPQELAQQIVKEIEVQIESAHAIRDPKVAAQKFLLIESQARKQLNDLREKYRIVRPRGVGLSKKTEREWGKYDASLKQLDEKIFTPIEKHIIEIVGREAEHARVELDRRLRIEAALDELVITTRKIARKENAETRETLEKVGKEVREATGTSISNVERVVSEVLRDFGHIDVTQLPDSSLIETRTRLENRILEVQQRERDFLSYLRVQLESIDIKPGGGNLDQMEALEQSNLALQEQADMDLQLTQLGMAVEIINHEFNGNVRSIRNNLRELKAWADINSGLVELYRNLRASFDHLDGYLTLFTPLHRRLYRNQIEITGEDIAKFISDLFAARFERHRIQFTATLAFRKHGFQGFPSSFYPVFVNLVDNAIFWLQDQNDLRMIRFDFRDNAMIVEDTGPGIPERDWQDIFEAGFTRKPGGRGLGLYISRESLKKVGYKIGILSAQQQWQTIFAIASEPPYTTE